MKVRGGTYVFGTSVLSLLKDDPLENSRATLARQVEGERTQIYYLGQRQCWHIISSKYEWKSH